MCLATIYVENGDKREELMHDVAWVGPGSGGVQLVTLMGETTLVPATIKSIDLMRSSIVLERTTASPAEE